MRYEKYFEKIVDSYNLRNADVFHRLLKNVDVVIDLSTTKTTLTVSPIPMAIEKKDEESATLDFLRHSETTWNTDGKIQGNSQEVLVILNHELLAAAACRAFPPKCTPDNMTSPDVHVFDAAYSGNNGRTHLTMQVLTGDLLGENCQKDARFNEQSLGCLEGLSKDEVIKHPEFKKMLKSPTYRISAVPDSMIAETGEEVIRRMLSGIAEVAHKNAGKNVAICCSQCSMNWLYRWLCQDYTKVLEIPNLGTICCRYYIATNEIQLIADGVLPFTTAVEKLRTMSLVCPK